MTPALKILVVDDEQNICTLLSELLNDKGHKITTAQNGYQAIEEVRKGSFDLILLDVIMPSMNGLDTYREIKKINPQIPTVMMSGYPVKRLVDQALSEGVKTCLDKPFDIDEVITIIEEVLEVKKETLKETPS